MTKQPPVDNNLRLRKKKYLLEERIKLMFICASHGFNHTDIAAIFGVDKSAVTRIMGANMQRYKDFLLNNSG